MKLEKFVLGLNAAALILNVATYFTPTGSNANLWFAALSAVGILMMAVVLFAESKRATGR